MSARVFSPCTRCLRLLPRQKDKENMQINFAAFDAEYWVYALAGLVIDRRGHPPVHGGSADQILQLVLIERARTDGVNDDVVRTSTPQAETRDEACV